MRFEFEDESAEYRAIARLRRLNYIRIRSAGSHGPADLIAAYQPIFRQAEAPNLTIGVRGLRITSHGLVRRRLEELK